MKIRVTIDDQSFEVEVGDLKARPVSAVVDGEPFEVWPEEQSAEQIASALVQQRANTNGGTPVKPAVAPSPVGASASSNAVTAPIPGVIISINVKAGDTVSVGQDLLILEAMKMKNNIRASRAGKIAVVCVAPGDQVKRGQVLLEFGG